MPEFKYPTSVDLEEQVTINGQIFPRYGRLRQRGLEHMGADAPVREDGALFDRLNPGKEIKPCLPSDRIEPMEVLPVNEKPGCGIYGDVGNGS